MIDHNFIFPIALIIGDFNLYEGAISFWTIVIIKNADFYFFNHNHQIHLYNTHLSFEILNKLRFCFSV